MGTEDGIGIKTELNEGMKKDLFAELPSVGEAMQKFDDPGLRTISWNIYSSDYAHGKSEDEKKEIAKRFDTETWEVYKEVIRSLQTNDVFHKKILEESGSLTNNQIRELVQGLNFVRDDIFEDIFHRVDMLMRHSVDVDLLCLMFGDLLKLKASQMTEQIFNKEEREEISRVFSEDKMCQELFLCAIADRRSVDYKTTDGDEENKSVENFTDRVIGLSNLRADAAKKKLESLFKSNTTNSAGHIFSSGFRQLLVRDSLAMVNLFLPNKIHTEKSLKHGIGDFCLERARKLEVVRNLIKIEDLQNEMMYFDLPEVHGYTVGQEHKTRKKVTNFIGLPSKTVNFGIVDVGVVDAKGDWLNKLFTRGEVVSASNDKDSNIWDIKFVKNWLEMWNMLGHERAHIWFFENIDRGDISNKLTNEDVESDIVWGFREDGDEFTDGRVYKTKILEVLDEGWSVLNQKLSLKFLTDNQEKFGDRVGEKELEMIEIMRKARIYQDRGVYSHYWLGQQITSSIFAQAFREDTDNLSGLKINEDLIKRRMNGLEEVKKFLMKLDLEKIASPKSRRLFETTRFEEDVEAPEIRRKVWIEDGDKMKLVWKIDKKNTLLDYMASTNVEKRKKGQDKFLELFGKDN